MRSGARVFFSVLASFVLPILAGCSPVHFATSASNSPLGITPGVNPAINTIQPALVSRATGCIMCHANISSNVITDFGYGGDGLGKNYFFGGVPGVLPSGLTNDEGRSVYGDYDFAQGGNANWAAAAFPSGTKVLVPHAPTAGLSIANPADTTLALYLQDMLGQDTGAKGVTVQEVSSVYIGAPTASRIQSVSGVSAGGLRFKPASQQALHFQESHLTPPELFIPTVLNPLFAKAM